MSTQEPKVTEITFDFDSYDFWSGWDDEDLENVDTSASMRKYFITVAKQIAESYGATWKASWSETGVGPKVYVTFADEDATGTYKIEESILWEATNPGFEQDDWVVE